MWGKKKKSGRQNSIQFRSVQSFSHVSFCNLWTAAHQASVSIINSESTLKLLSTKLVMPSDHLILCHPLLTLPSIFKLISFRIDWFGLLAVQGTLKSLLQHHTSKASLALSFLYSRTLTSIHDHWKNHSFD